LNAFGFSATSAFFLTVGGVRPRVLIDKLLQEKPLEKGVTIMSGETDVVKGRIKEAAGTLTGNDKLRAEGETDQVVGKTKQAIQKAADTVKEAVKKTTG